MLKMAIIFVFSIIFMCMLSGLLPAQPLTMHIKMKNGTVHSFDLKDIRKMTFQVCPYTDIAAGTGDLLQTFALYQNYPNPFNPTTTIEYAIPKAGTVRIRIFNLLGQRVHQLDREHAAAGSYKYMWNAKNGSHVILGSGLYVVMVEFGNAVLIRKMVLIN
ncbi:MAG: T9SS type A sorting domain-containing protein [candidate division KSB1 bacterium]|nr:T9SS type A sorting domain-containing protein [candidate division KSB1 bacterium]